MSNKILLLAILSIFLVSFTFADAMWYDFTNDYAVDGNAKLNVYIDAGGDGIPDAGYDVNVIVHIGDQNFILDSNTSSEGYAEFNFDFNHEGYLESNGNNIQIEIIDLENDINKTMEFYQPEFKDLDLNWQVDKVLDIEQDQNIVFNPIFYDENGNLDSSFDGNFKLYLFNPLGECVGDYNVYPDQNVEIPFEDFNSEVGKYKLMIGNLDGNEELAGYKTFTFDVMSFKLVAYVQDAEMDESKSAFGVSEELELVVFAIDMNGDILTLNNLYYQIDGSDLVDGSGFIEIKTKIGGLFDELTEGSHKIKVIGTIGDYNQSIDLQFDYLNFGSDALMKKNENAGTKERFSGAYAPDGNTTFFFGVKDFEENDYTDFNEETCNLFLAGLEYSKPGFKSKVEIEDFDVNYNTNQSLCEVTFSAPSDEGEFIFNLDLNEDFNASFGDNLDAEIKLNVQKYNLFLDPIDPESAIDEVTGEVDKKADKFEFFDENIGFVVNVVNLQDGTQGEDLNVEDISLLKVIDDGAEYLVDPDEFDYNSETKLLIISKTADALQDVTGGFEVQALFDTNYNDSQIKSYGASKKKTFNISVDLNMDSYEGPPYVTPDQNVVVVVTANNSSDSAIDYSPVMITRVFNFETMEELDLSDLIGYDADGIPTPVNNLIAITDSTGIAYFNLGSGLDIGMYEITIAVDSGEQGDEGRGFFMVKHFFAFGFPGDLQQGGAFLENAYIGRNDDIDIATFVFSGEGFGDSEFADTSDYEIVTGTAKLFFETDDGTGRKQIDASVEYAGSDVNWTKGQCPNCQIDPGKMARITPSKTLIPGIYEALYDVNYLGDVDTAMTRFTIQGFGVQVCSYTEMSVTCGESMMGEGGKGNGTTFSPDSNALFVLNGGSPGDIQLTISLIDEKNFGIVPGTEDLNYYVNGVLEEDRQFNFNSNPWAPGEDANIDVALPYNVPLGEYEILFDFVKDGVHTKYSRFITVKQFEIVITKDTTGSRESRYVEDWQNGGIDTNILNTDTWWIEQLCNGRNAENTFVIDGIDYNAFVHPGMGGGQSDINYPMLIDLDNSFIYIDSDWDCNFVGDLNIVAGTKEIVNELADENGAAPMFTSVTLQSVKHILIPDDLESMGGDMQNNWLGEFDVGRDIIMPLVITTVDGEPIQDVNVVVNKVKKVDFLNGNMETMTSGYTVVNDNNTDENGVVFIKMNVEETGEYQLELIMTDSQERREKLMPWEGPVFQIKKLSSEFGFIGESRYNNELKTVDLNYFANELIDSEDRIMFYGLYSEAESGDIDGNLSSDKNFYFTYDSQYSNRFQMDDDSNLAEWNDSFESYGMKRTDIGVTWPTCLGDYNFEVTDGQKNSCSDTSAIMQASSEDYNLETNIFAARGLDWSFEDSLNGWNATGQVYQTEAYPAIDGSKSLIIPGNVYGYLNDSIFIPEQNELYDLNYCAFGSEDALDLNIRLFYEGQDGNKYYNFDLDTWDTNISDVNSSYNWTSILTTDWSCFSKDINVESIERIYLNVVGDNNSDHNYIVDAFQFNGELTTHRISFYNRTSYRLLPDEIVEETRDQNGNSEFENNYMIWTDSNVVDTNHYMEVSFKDRLRNDLELGVSSVEATLIKRGTCAMMNGPMRMDLVGQFTGTRLTLDDENIDSWVFNFGDLGEDLTSEDPSCIMFDMRVDISTNIGGTLYEDTAWNNFFMRNNETE